MATREFIRKRIEGKQKEITKLESKLERIKKAKASGWEVNPYFYSEYDLNRTDRELTEARASLEKYQKDLETETDKAASRNIKVILEFLEGWKKTVSEFYLKRFSAYPDAYKTYQSDLKENKLDWYEDRKLKREDPEAWREYNRKIERMKSEFTDRFGFIQPYIGRAYNQESQNYEWVFDIEKLQKELNTEADQKYDFIIDRTNKIVKVITDASGLTIGSKGDLNGFIIGTNGTAKVQTIGAGGYNIQCYHFRTLINRMK